MDVPAEAMRKIAGIIVEVKSELREAIPPLKKAIEQLKAAEKSLNQAGEALRGYDNINEWLEGAIDKEEARLYDEYEKKHGEEAAEERNEEGKFTIPRTRIENMLVKLEILELPNLDEMSGIEDIKEVIQEIEKTLKKISSDSFMKVSDKNEDRED